MMEFVAIFSHMYRSDRKNPNNETIIIYAYELKSTTKGNSEKAIHQYQKDTGNDEMPLMFEVEFLMWNYTKVLRHSSGNWYPDCFMQLAYVDVKKHFPFLDPLAIDEYLSKKYSRKVNKGKPQIDDHERQELKSEISILVQRQVVLKASLDIKSIIYSVFKKYQSKSNDRKRALKIAAKVPSQLMNVLGNNQEFGQYALDSQFDFNHLMETIVDFKQSSSEHVLETIESYIDDENIKRARERLEKGITSKEELLKVAEPGSLVRMWNQEIYPEGYGIVMSDGKVLPLILDDSAREKYYSGNAETDRAIRGEVIGSVGFSPSLTNKVMMMVELASEALKKKRQIFGQTLDCPVSEITQEYRDKQAEYILFFDTETTGLPRNWNAPISDLENWPRLVQIAWILCDDSGARIEENMFIIKPDGYGIPKESANVHGITTERANKEGKALREVLTEFLGALRKASKVVAHNIAFDEKIVGAEFLRMGLDNRLKDLPRVCTMNATTEYVGIKNDYGYKWPTLSELHIKLFGADFEGAHDAYADISATVDCYWEAKRIGLL